METYEHSLTALECRIPTVVTRHDTPLRYAWIMKHWYPIYHLFIAWRVIRKADRLVCVSPYTAAHIQRYFFPRALVDVVPNGLPPEVFQRGQRRLQAPAAPNRPFTFCGAGNWGRLKNMRALLEAFARVRARELHTCLVLWGQKLGPGQAAEQWAGSRGLSAGVEFADSVPRETILDFLEKEADLFVHPSLVETHGMVLIESMACGVPVLGNRNAGAVAWTLEDGNCGFLCDARDVAALADEMVRAVKEPTRNRASVERAWSSVSRRFRLEDAAAANENILRSMTQPSETILVSPNAHYPSHNWPITMALMRALRSQSQPVRTILFSTGTEPVPPDLAGAVKAASSRMPWFWKKTAAGRWQDRKLGGLINLWETLSCLLRALKASRGHPRTALHFVGGSYWIVVLAALGCRRVRFVYSLYGGGVDRFADRHQGAGAPLPQKAAATRGGHRTIRLHLRK